MWIRVVPVRLGEELYDVLSQIAEQVGCDRAGGAVAGIEHDLELLLGLHFGEQHLDVGLLRRLLAPLPLAGLEVLLADELEQLLNLRPVDCLHALAHLEAVVLDRIVTAGDLDAAVGPEMGDGVVQTGCR